MLYQRHFGEELLESYACLTPLRAAGEKPPLFLMCWEGGRLLAYERFIEYLPADQPIYGLRAPDFGRALPYPTIQDLAGLFVDEIRRFRPAGPYLLAGYCFGGALAHEMAFQLESQGEYAHYLGAISSLPYGHGGRRPRGGVNERSRALLTRLGGRRGFGKLKLVINQIFGQWGWLRRGLRRTAYRTVRRTGWRWPARLCNVKLVAIRDAMTRYVAPYSNARLTLFKPHLPGTTLEPTPWVNVARGGVRLCPITAPGIGHVRIMREPYVVQLAAAFVETLEASLETVA